MTASEAQELFGPLQQFYLELREVTGRARHEPWLVRTLMAAWTRRVSAETDRLGDIVEALAWGADEDLRAFVRESIEEFEEVDR
jgi:hypothetical protein